MERTALLEIIADQKKYPIASNLIERECFKEGSLAELVGENKV